MRCSPCHARALKFEFHLFRTGARLKASIRPSARESKRLKDPADHPPANATDTEDTFATDTRARDRPPNPRGQGDSVAWNGLPGLQWGVETLEEMKS